MKPFHIRRTRALHARMPVDHRQTRYPRNHKRLGDCSVSAPTLARQVLYLVCGGGDLQEAPYQRQLIAAQHSELAGSQGSGRGYEPRLTRQRIGSYDRLAWTFDPNNTQSATSGLGCTNSSAGWRDGSRRDRSKNPVSGFGAKRSIPGGYIGHRSVASQASIGGCSGLSRDASAGVHFWRRCSAHHTPESAAHTATAAEVAPRRRFHVARSVRQGRRGPADPPGDRRLTRCTATVPALPEGPECADPPCRRDNG
jgi:hypothetical protein